MVEWLVRERDESDDDFYVKRRCCSVKRDGVEWFWWELDKERSSGWEKRELDFLSLGGMHGRHRRRWLVPRCLLVLILYSLFIGKTSRNPTILYKIDEPSGSPCSFCWSSKMMIKNFWVLIINPTWPIYSMARSRGFFFSTPLDCILDL